MADQGQTDTNRTKLFERLPKNVVPSHYKITLEPDLIKHTFRGEVVVNVNIKEETQKIILNSLDLDIKETAFTSSDGYVIDSSNVELNTGDEQLIVSLPSSLKAGTSGELKIVFTGVLNDKLKGFYRARYPQGEGKPDKWAATTHFEPTHARRAFPCWDEPAIRATFEIKMIAPVDQACLSNMPVVSENVRADGKKEVLFGVSPIMSTYLVAFIVGEYEYVESKSMDGNVTVRVYTPPGKKDQGEFSLEIAAKALPFYSKYFNIDYALRKLDLIALSDFAIGAMENWGLITFRETCLLVDPKNTPASQKENIALIVTHEIAHQWFGNLVTMEWWTHLWLKEGFASFIEYLCVDNLFPQYHIWSEFVTSTYSSAMELDALHNSHPIEVPVNNPSEVVEIFDSISYNKGASVIRMLYNYLGDEDFRKGMFVYLNRFKYQSAQTENLWQALGEASSKPVKEVMTTWTKQKGYPVISVSQTVEGNNRVIKLSQEKFCADGKIPDSEKDRLWMVPLTFTTTTSPDKPVNSTLLSTKNNEIVLSNVNPSDWIKINHNAVGVYRVQYSSEMLEQLSPAIESKALPPLDRLSIQDDLFTLVQAGKNSTVEILKLLENFKNEDEYSVWSSISGCLGQLNVLLSHTDFQPYFHVWGRKLLQPIYQKLGWEPKKGEDHTDFLLRSVVLGRLAAFEDPSVIQEAKKLFDAYASGTLSIPADLRSAVYSAVARTADDKTFNTFFRLYREADQQQEKDRLSKALGAVSDINKLEKVLNFSISDEVRSQDSVFVIGSVAANKLGRELAWTFFKDHAKIFRERYEGLGFLPRSLVMSLTKNFASEEKAQEVASFFAKNPFAGTERAVQQSLENIRLNADWLARDAADIKTFVTNSASSI